MTARPRTGPGGLLTSQEIARILGVSAATVRRWASAGLLPAERTAGGHRRFSLALAERLASEKGGWTLDLDGWIGALVGPEGGLKVDSALLAERSRRDGWRAVAEGLGAVLEELGNRWHAGQLSVIEEHLASSRLGRALARVSDGLPVRPGAPRVLLVAVEGEAHTLGLSLVEPCMRERGWQTLWIGRDTPTALLADRVAIGDLDVVAVSASVARDPAELRASSDVLAPACLRGRATLLVGGKGPWPESLEHGVVIRDFARLGAWMEALDDERRRAR